MPNYGDINADYGDSLYGEAAISTKGVRNRVGTDFDLAINGVGLKLVPVKDAYHKKVAQTFSYNPRSLFKQGDGAALVAKDLYYWSRLEHSRWDGGETYDPWKPGDTSDPSRRDTKFASSLGFDTSDQYKLSHLRDIYVSPSYEFVLSNDGPLAYWILGDHPSSTVAFDQISSDRTPGTVYPGVTEGVFPGPIVNDPNTIDVFDGVTGVIKTPGRVPFTGNHTAGAWSLEAWAAPAKLPQKGIIAMVGQEAFSPPPTNYEAAVQSDSPSLYWPLNDVNPTALDLSASGTHIGTYSGSYSENQSGYTGSASVLYSGGHTLSNAATPITGSVGSIECWFYATSNTGGHTIWATGSGTGLLISSGALSGGGPNGKLNWRNNFFGGGGAAGVVCNGPTLNAWHHLVIVLISSVSSKVYLDGVDVTAQGNVGGGFTLNGASDGNFEVGDASWGDGPFAGKVSDVAYYPVALSAAQVLAHFNAAPGSSSTLSLGGFGFGVASTDGSTTGLELMLRLPGVGWFDTSYAFATEVPVSSWDRWWYRSRFIGGILFHPYDLVPAPNVWHHIVAASDGAGTIKVYVDGVLKATISQTAAVTDSYASIGAARLMTNTFVDSGIQNPFNGQVCQVAVYGTQLSAAQALAHYNSGIGASAQTLITAGQSYARFIETFDGRLYINQQNAKIDVSNDGGVSWSSVTLPGGDVTTITAMWSSGPKVYVATGSHIYLGDYTGFTAIEGVNPAIAGATCGLYYSGQLYIGLGTSLYYVDPATGIKTQLYDTKSFTLAFVEAFQGKIWFGGSAGRQTKVWTWTNNTLPPSPANGVGAQLQDGTIPYGFVVQSTTVYLNVLLLGGLISGDSTTEGQGAVYYIEPAGSFGQLCVLGPPMSKVRGTGIDYGVRSMWGADDRLWVGYNNLTGVGVYNFVTGSFSTNSRTTKYVTATVNAVCRVQGRNLFTVKDDGNCWREGSTKVMVAVMEESEFQELPFIPKIIDGIEGMHSPLRTGEQVEVQISYDFGVTWQSLGINSTVGVNEIDFSMVNTQANHWRTRVLSSRGGDSTVAPEIYSHSVRFAPRNTPKHEWVVESLLPVRQRTTTGAILTDPGSKLLASLWTAYEDGLAIEYIDRDKQVYRCLILFMDEGRDRFTPARSEAGQLNLAPAVHIELLEVEKVS